MASNRFLGDVGGVRSLISRVGGNKTSSSLLEDDSPSVELHMGGGGALGVVDCSRGGSWYFATYFLSTLLPKMVLRSEGGPSNMLSGGGGSSQPTLLVGTVKSECSGIMGSVKGEGEEGRLAWETW